MKKGCYYNQLKVPKIVIKSKHWEIYKRKELCKIHVKQQTWDSSKISKKTQKTLKDKINRCDLIMWIINNKVFHGERSK